MPLRHLSSFRAFAGVAASVGLSSVVLAQPDTPQTPPPAQTPGELLLHKWSGTLNVPDPVACAVDPQGRVYVAATTRRKVADLDIREHAMWIPNDVGLDSVAAKTAFYEDVLAPGKLRQPRGGLKDHNGDGSIDWKDLTVHSERIYQMRDTDGDGTADKMTVFAEGFNTPVTGIAAGVLYHDGWLYATIAPDLWRFKDNDDDGVADVREIVVHGFGIHIAYAGHDMHGLSVGPDGRIYWSIGDKGVNVTSREGRHFYYPNEGAVLRIEPDGSGFEVYAHGLRNPQEPAFDDYGDLFAVDNDADMAGERERFVYIVEGSDSGWRCNFQYMKEAAPWMRDGLWKPLFPGQPAYLLPALSNYSDGPAGFRYNPGTALGEKQRDLFILNEFPSGKMRGFRAERDGASFTMADSRVLNEGVMGIGLSWHPDGSLIMADWIGGYPLDGLGAIWRVDARAGIDTAARRETQQLLAAGFTKTAEATLLAQLGHRDQRVRQGAQGELARRGLAAPLLAVALAADAPRLTRIHGLWGYGQLLRRTPAAAGTQAAALQPLLTDRDPELRAQVAKILGDAPAASRALAPGLITLLTDAEPRARLQAALALGKLQAPAAVDALFTLAETDSAAPVLRHAAMAGLTGCATPEQLAAKAGASSRDVRLASVVALRRQRSARVADFLRDPDPAVVEEASRAIHDDAGIPAALPALVDLPSSAQQTDATTLRRLNAALRVGTTDSAARLLAFALDDSAKTSLRREALLTLRAWPQPAPLDRVDGYARRFQTVKIDTVLTPKLDALLALTDPGLKTLAVEIVLAHALTVSAEQIAAIVAEAKAPGELRAQALRLMAGNREKPAVFAQALDTALAPNSPAPLHRAGMELLLPDQVDRLVTETSTVLAQRSDAEKQHALALLARAATPAADALLGKLGDELLAGTCAPALQLDVIEALRARGDASPALAAKLKTFTESAAGATHGELLAGGRGERGRDIVMNHLNANCMACHAIDAGGGSEVGPNLRAIGTQRTPDYILESLLVPSAKIATGYGIVSVTLKDGTEVSGTLASETPEAVTVRLFDGTRRTVTRDQIGTLTPPVSVMPSMTGILEPRELRDVVAFLSTLTGRRAPPPPAEEH